MLVFRGHGAAFGKVLQTGQLLRETVSLLGRIGGAVLADVGIDLTDVLFRAGR